MRGGPSPNYVETGSKKKRASAEGPAFKSRSVGRGRRVGSLEVGGEKGETKGLLVGKATLKGPDSSARPRGNGRLKSLLRQAVGFFTGLVLGGRRDGQITDRKHKLMGG